MHQAQWSPERPPTSSFPGFSYKAEADSPGRAADKSVGPDNPDRAADNRVDRAADNRVGPDNPGRTADNRVGPDSPGQAAHRQAAVGKPALWADDKPIAQTADKPAEQGLAGERVRADTGQLEDPEQIGEPGRAEAEQALQAALTEAELRSSHRNYQCSRLLRN